MIVLLFGNHIDFECTHHTVVVCCWINHNEFTCGFDHVTRITITIMTDTIFSSIMIAIMITIVVIVERNQRPVLSLLIINAAHYHRRHSYSCCGESQSLLFVHGTIQWVIDVILVKHEHQSSVMYVDKVVIVVGCFCPQIDG